MGCSPWGCYKSDMTEQLHFHASEKEMATYSSVLAWRILIVFLTKNITDLPGSETFEQEYRTAISKVKQFDAKDRSAIWEIGRAHV